MKKIMVVGSSLKDRGGIVTVMDNIMNSSLKEEFKFELVETYITGSKKERAVMYFKGLRKLLSKLMTDKPDLVHIHMSYKGSFYRKSLILLLVKLFKVPVFIHVHGSSFKDFYSSLGNLGKKYCHFILNQPERLIVLSNEWYNFFSQFVNKNNIETLYNAVPEIDQEFSRNNIEPACLFMGRLGQRKGTYDLLKSIKILKDKGVKGKFLLAGDGEIEEVKKELVSLNIEDYVSLLGWINNEEKKELLIQSDILVLPSYNEGLPMAILEGMSYGLPIVSTPVGGIPEAVEHGRNGFLVEPGTVDDLALYLEKLIDDAQLRITMGKENQNAIRQSFSLNTLMKQLSKAYNQAIENK
ncbi:glycosyltransferase family 4 protein [Bacillus sp. OTU530]|uniref:glycosyltransferase family 4 protein n=1 Tax=Bacillus sp. OTU530 TaxID=3043862 RepID=UPI00313B8CBD